MSGPERDEEFEAFLKRRSPLHRRLSDFDHAEPPVELDRIVLGRAREAIEAPRNPPIFRAARWAMPVGLAATILLAFAIVLNVNRHVLEPTGKAGSEPALAALQAQAPREALAPTAAGTSAADEAGGTGTSVAVGDDIRTRDAESWLREIARLRADGKVVEAERELEAFRRAFPSHSGNALAKPPTR